MEYVEACNMNAFEFAVLSRILSKVQKFDPVTDIWDNSGYCSLSIQSIADTFSMDREVVQRSIKVLELAGISSVQRRYGSTNTITVTPHTDWVVTDFRELREKAKGKRSPSPSPVAHVTDTVTPSPDTVTDTSLQGYNVRLKTSKTTPKPDTVTPSRSPIPSPILKPKDTVTDNNGYRHNAYAVNLPLPVIGSPCPEDIKAKYCKRSPILSPSPDTVTDTATDTVTPITLPVMDSSGNAIDTVTISVGKSKSRKSRKYSPSPGQYEDSDNDDLPIFGMSYPEYRASDLWNRK